MPKLFWSSPRRSKKLSRKGSYSSYVKDEDEEDTETPLNHSNFEKSASVTLMKSSDNFAPQLQMKKDVKVKGKGKDSNKKRNTSPSSVLDAEEELGNIIISENKNNWSNPSETFESWDQSFTDPSFHSSFDCSTKPEKLVTRKNPNVRRETKHRTTNDFQSKNNAIPNLKKNNDISNNRVKEENTNPTASQIFKESLRFIFRVFWASADLYRDVLLIEDEIVSPNSTQLRRAYLRAGKLALATPIDSEDDVTYVSIGMRKAASSIFSTMSIQTGTKVSKGAKKIFQAIHLAYEILKNPRQRRKYDKWLLAHPRLPPPIDTTSDKGSSTNDIINNGLMVESRCDSNTRIEINQTVKPSVTNVESENFFSSGDNEDWFAKEYTRQKNKLPAINEDIDNFMHSNNTFRDSHHNNPIHHPSSTGNSPQLDAAIENIVLGGQRFQTNSEPSFGQWEGSFDQKISHNPKASSECNPTIEFFEVYSSKENSIKKQEKQSTNSILRSSSSGTFRSKGSRKSQSAISWNEEVEELTILDYDPQNEHGKHYSKAFEQQRSAGSNLNFITTVGHDPDDHSSRFSDIIYNDQFLPSRSQERNNLDSYEYNSTHPNSKIKKNKSDRSKEVSLKKSLKEKLNTIHNHKNRKKQQGQSVEVKVHTNSSREEHQTSRNNNAHAPQINNEDAIDSLVGCSAGLPGFDTFFDFQVSLSQYINGAVEEMKEGLCVLGKTWNELDVTNLENSNTNAPFFLHDTELDALTGMLETEIIEKSCHDKKQ
mmetsp:Transcript_18527/g.26080  ORF Transcript_18527/g.26080 Transcript_18527/m.26080 type:complete len:766 (+) Transcript_18527:206-2503(+)|eukprot:CAMPEP_0184855224 /NCGR_PEP_ID=MMETSP0580-20130426/526_1 /TAXON_ID=1118495 /ORGANISM="Dactyliosolen fragilissimus" /LENGTH=765 /DNA_ID=CAMNT_0027349681 /DNA_START=174 /DNA_END=2471 /DNA_ORIENTATION=-